MLETIEGIRRTALNVCHRLRWLPSLLARVIVGLVFVPSGWGKLHNLPDIADFFRSLGIPAPELQAPFVSGLELVGGLMVLAGLGARLMAVPLIGTMVVAILTAVWPNADGIVDLLGKIEPMLIALLTQVAITGPGAVSLDALIARWLGGTRRSPAGATVAARA
jgi:putative oxidoreductase